MPQFRSLVLHPDRNAFEMQPNETSKSFARFCAYRDMHPNRRSLAKVAEQFGVSLRLVEQQSVAHQWRERCRQWDAHQDAERRKRIAERDKVLAEVNMASAVAAADVTRRSVEYVRDSGVVLEPLQLKAWVQMMLDLRRSAVEAPDQVVQIKGSDEQPLQVEVAEFAGLTAEAKRARAQEIVEGVQRLYAIDGGKTA